MDKIKKMIEDADDAYYKEEYDKAIELYNKILEFNSKNKHAQEYSRKAEELRKLIANADSAYYDMEYDQAIELYKQALALSPENIHVRQCLRKTEELKKLIERADDAYYAAEYDKATKLYYQILDLDTGNKHAQEKIRKAERNRLSKITTSEIVPTEALQLYKRSRSFIAVGDLILARKFLRQAIDIAEEAGVNFTSAQYLLGNIQNALKAEEFKAKAHNEIDAGQWAKAVDDLNSAVNLDPTDDVVGTLLSHLRSLLNTKNLLERLKLGDEKIKSQSAAIAEIRKTINLTNDTPVLSKLWQEVVKAFGEYNHRSVLIREVLQVFVSTIGVLLITFCFFYLYPRHKDIEVECDSVASGLQATLNYPYYVAKRDVGKIEIVFKNTGKSEISDTVKFDFDNGTANVKFSPPSKSNVIEIKNLIQGEERLEMIYFYVDGSNSKIPNPWYLNFSVDTCVPEPPYTPKDLYIAMTPIPKLGSVWLWLLGGSGITAVIVGFFREKLFSLFFQKKAE